MSERTLEEERQNRDAYSFGLIDFVEILARQGRRLVVLTIGVGIASAGISLILPAWYRSEATVFGPEEVSEARRVLTTLRSLSIPGVRQNVGVASPETFLAILESRRLRERIVEQFDLVKALRAKGVEDALRKLGKRVWVGLENTGVIRVTVEDRDRQRAAAIANAMIEELDKINVEIRIYKARRARQHLETQLQVTRERLATAEDSLARFQRENLAVSIDEQARAAVQSVAELEARAIQLRIRKGIAEDYQTTSNPELRAITRELAELEARLSEAEIGSGEVTSPGQIPLAALPDLGIRLARLLREVKVGEALLALLAEDCEEARLAEARETPVVQVLDQAVPAERRARPRRTILVLSWMAIAFAVSAAYAVAAARYEMLASTDERRRWAAALGSAMRWQRSGGHES